MTQEITGTYFILPEGAVQEEPRTWEEIEALAGAGLLAADTLIFLPEENDWKRAADTKLAPFFTAEVAPREALDSHREELEAQYRELVDAIGPGSDWNPRVQAAELAVKLDKREAAVSHFRDALEANPFHPRIVQEAKRLLSPTERAQLPFVDRVEPVWDDLPGMALYPLRSGPVHLLIPIAVLAGLSFVPGGVIVSALLLFVWSVEVTRTAAGQNAGPPSWQSFVVNPLGAILRPAKIAGAVALEVYGPFVAIAGLIALAGPGDYGIPTVIAKSPLILVPMFIATLVYIPAVIVLAACPDVSVGSIADPRNIAAAIGRMEREYLISAGILLAQFVVWFVVGSIFGRLPFVSNAVSAAAGVYLVLTGGFVMSRLHARFRDHFSRGSKA